MTCPEIRPSVFWTLISCQLVVGCLQDPVQHGDVPQQANRVSEV